MIFFVPFYVCWRRAWHQLLSGRAVLEIQQRHFVAFSRRGATAEQRGTSHAVICRCRISDNTRCCLWFMIYECCVLGYHEILGGDRSDGAWYFTFVCTVMWYSSHGHVLFGYLAFSEISCNRQLRRATLKPPMSLGGFSGSNAKWSMRHRWFPLRLGVMFLSGEGTLPDEALAAQWNALFSPHLRKYQRDLWRMSLFFWISKRFFVDLQSPRYFVHASLLPSILQPEPWQSASAYWFQRAMELEEMLRGV